MNFFKVIQMVILCFPFLLISGCIETEENEISEAKAATEVRSLVFAIYTADKASSTVKEFAPVIAWLEEDISKRLGETIKIRMQVSDQYLKAIGDLVEGRADFSRLGPASYIKAFEDNPELDLLAMESKNGERFLKGIFAVHKDSQIDSLKEVKGRSFAFGDPLSTIGRYLCQAELLKVGISDKDLSYYEFLGRHDTVGMAVAAKDFDVGALKSSSFRKLMESGEPLRKLADFDSVTKPWVSHPDLDPEVRDALRAAMLEITDEDAEKIGLDGFLKAKDEYYEPIRRSMAESEGFSFKKRGDRISQAD